ncbi:HEAT repeat domain-containing protein [Microvirga arabica]|uniref:HEAT repeat domain-containing protein n=1 Tax=Microvirga arabica TaxID=1128671 RepID=A0ABV6Y6S5_9HYPH
MDPLRVFLSSPGDVADERNLARSLLKEELPYDPLLPDDVAFRVISWDDPAAPTPMLANLTPQEAVNRFGPKPSECDVVVVVLWSRLGSHLDLRTFKKPNGEPYRSGSEWEFEDARDAKEPPAILVYRRTEIPEVKLNDPKWVEKREQYDLVEQFFTSFKNQDGSFRGGFTSYAKPTEFKERLEKDLKHLLRERFRCKTPDVGAGARAALSTQAWSKPPYPGLRSFVEEEAAIFFGRGREVDALISRLRDPTQRFLAIVGSSGSGKSSLVRAGLLPRLAAGAIEGSQGSRVLTFTPGAVSDNPFVALAIELHDLLPVHAQKPADIAEALAAAPQCLSDRANEILADQSPDAVLVLFIDQFEELFTLAAEDHRTGFIQLLARAAADPHLRVIVTLRADFLSQCAAEPALGMLLQAGTFVLGAPGPVALADMIRKPAERAGLDLEEGLADEIVKDAGSNPGALPLVAFCLEELYRQHGSERRLTLDHYRGMGGLRGAITRRVEALLMEFQEAEATNLDTILPQMFSALVHVDAAGKAARQRASWDDLAGSLPMAQLVRMLVDGRLLLTEEVSGRAVVMLAHEALIQEWSALSEWLDRNQSQLQRLQLAFSNLKSSAPTDRAYATQALGEIGAITPEVVPALIDALSDTNKEVCWKAATALGRIGPVTPEVVPALITALGDTAAAAAALGRIGAVTPKVVPALIAALGDTSKDASATSIRWQAVDALGNIGPVTPEVVPALVGILTNADTDHVSQVAEALAKIGQPAVAALINVLTNAGGDVCWRAGEALGKIGAPAVPALVRALTHFDESVRWTAAKSLGEIGSATPEVVPALITALFDLDLTVSSNAIRALGKIGPVTPEVVPALIYCLDIDELAAVTAAEELGKIGPVTPEVVPALIGILNHPEMRVRWTAAHALGKIGPVTPEVLPALISALDDVTEDVRSKVAKTLKDIEAADVGRT